MALAQRNAGTEPIGSALPRIAPPIPARSDVPGFRKVAQEIGITLMPWQETAARYLTAQGPDGKLYREVCIVVGRQNGKTTLMKPYIIDALRLGKRILHIAATREIPREMFPLIANELSEDLFQKRRGKGGRLHTIWPRYGAGQEEILLENGGWYRIAAANGGSRGRSADIVIVDELRELTDEIARDAWESTTTMSEDPQYVYLSNAGHDDSVVLNEVRSRRETDPGLAYLEWSADPNYDTGDVRGWVQSNPAIGHLKPVLRTLTDDYRKATLSPQKMPGFETEHLCRWVSTMRQPLVSEFEWVSCRGDLGPASRPSLAVSMSPEGNRASVAMAWRTGDAVSVRLLLEATGSPIDTDALGEDVRKLAAKNGIREVGHDPMTDRELVKYVPKGRAKAVGGAEFGNASAQFVNLVTSRTLRWDAGDQITTDLKWTSRKDTGDGKYHAVRAQDDRPITAALAVIRAVWLASGPVKPKARVM